MLVITRKVNETVVVRDRCGSLAIIRVLDIAHVRTRLQITPGSLLAGHAGEASATCELFEGHDVSFGAPAQGVIRIATAKDDRVRLALRGEGIKFWRGEVDAA